MTDKIAMDRAELDRIGRTLGRIADQIDGTPSDTALDMVPESAPSRVLRHIADALRAEGADEAGTAGATVVPVRRAAEGQR